MHTPIPTEIGMQFARHKHEDDTTFQEMLDTLYGDEAVAPNTNYHTDDEDAAQEQVESSNTKRYIQMSSIPTESDDDDLSADPRKSKSMVFRETTV